MALKEIRKVLANTEDRGDNFLRAIANYPDWFLTVDDRNCAVLWEIEGKQTLGVMTERQSPDAKQREFLEMRGRHLMNNLPDETETVCFDLGTDHGVCLTGEALGRLKNIALALSCEEALSLPAVPSDQKCISDKMDKVVQHEWILLWNQEHPLLMTYKGLEAVMLFTAFDTVDAFLGEQPDPTVFQLNHMPGHELFAVLQSRDDFDGVYINPESALELWPFAPAQIHQLAEGKQPRMERKILRARCLDEINHFLDECGMQSTTYTVETIDGQEVWHYAGDMLPGVEKRSFRFYPVAEKCFVDSWGDGESKIVCAGKLANLLQLRLTILAGEKLPLDASMRSWVQSTLIWANELRKMIDTTTTRIERTKLRTADGARFVREKPEIGTLEFVEGAVDKLKALLS